MQVCPQQPASAAWQKTSVSRNLGNWGNAPRQSSSAAHATPLHQLSAQISSPPIVFVWKQTEHIKSANSPAQGSNGIGPEQLSGGGGGGGGEVGGGGEGHSPSVSPWRRWAFFAFFLPTVIVSPLWQSVNFFLALAMETPFLPAF
jgi:hypothetical protein